MGRELWDMGVFEALSIVLFVGLPLLFLLLLMWGIALHTLHQKVPPRPHDPTSHFDIRAERWADAPRTVADFGFGSRVTADGDLDTVEVAELLSLADGSSSGETNDVSAVATLRLASGETITHTGTVNSERNLRPGSWVPYHPRGGTSQDEFNPAWDLDRDELREVLITHRLRRGLVDVVDAAELVAGQPFTATVHSIRATGQVDQGHVEVILAVEHDNDQAEITALLRPEEIATARHSRQVPLIVTYDGRWLVWPTWY